MNKTALSNLAKARAYLQFHEPYFGTALWAIRFVEVNELASRAGGPLGTDFHWRVYYDPKIVETLSLQQTAATLSHELHHIIRAHKVRADVLGVCSVNWKAWNICADAEINDDLEKQAHIDRKGLPWRYATPQRFGWKPDQTAEIYYRNLPQQACPCPGQGDKGGEPQGGKGGGKPCPHHDGANCGSGAHGQTEEWEKESESQGAGRISKAESLRIQKQVAEEIKNHAKRPGTVPAGLVRWAESFGKPTIDWARRLANRIRSRVSQVRGRFDYTYGNLNRRQNFYLFIQPSMIAPIPRVAIVIDTSASMSQNDLGKCMAETKGVLASLGIGMECVTLFAVDAEVNTPQQIVSVKDICLKGGGGTDMRLGISAANAHNKRLDVIIVMTDGETPWPDHRERAHVIACLTSPESQEAVPTWIETVVVK